MEFSITDTLTIEDVSSIISGNKILALSPEAIQRITACRDYLDKKTEHFEAPIYGVNTGFGALYNKTISNDDLSLLQRNLLVSHACGMGDEVPQEIVALMLLLKVQSLSYGNSGVQVETVQRLIDYFNSNIYPVVYQLGSLGASGDLAPLSHLSLPLIGMGEVDYRDGRLSGTEANKIIGKGDIILKGKEGLALINGTQFMGAYGLWCVMQAEKLSALADKIAALSLDAYDGRTDAFDVSIARVRRHSGHMATVLAMQEWLQGSELAAQQKAHVQDPYSFRCIPQVHGASKDAIEHVKNVIGNEINSVTDNPLVFPEENKVISGGNFHGQPLALVLDYLAIALAELGSISERRTYLLISGQRGLPPFLAKNAGLNSGFMIPQYTAAAIVSQNKQLCTPASVDSIVSSNGQEDHVSMGANSATKAYKVVKNLERILAIELMNAAQALEFRRPWNSSPKLEQWYTEYRDTVPFIENDAYLHEYLEKTVTFLQK